MKRRVLALPWLVGPLALGCGDDRDFGPERENPPLRDGGDTTVAADGGASDGGSSNGTVTTESETQTADTQVTIAFTPDGGDQKTTDAPDAGPPLPTLDGPCTKGGARTCDGNDPKQTLVCSQGRWQSNGGCTKKENCDPEVGACSEIVPECTGLTLGDRYCLPGDELWECGVNLVNSEQVDTCDGLCVPDGDSAKCVAPKCGDGKTQDDEICDDGNADENDTCTSLCAPPKCGDGIKQDVELCDDGNDDESDSCTTLCMPPICGDDIVQDWEECEDLDHDLDNEDECSTLCKFPACGDTLVQSLEMCDDGNLDAGDGCSPLCKAETIAVASRYYHSCALRANGHVKCWGYNGSGQLGLGIAGSNIGDAPYEMGGYLSEVELGYGRTALAVAPGYTHTCAILDNQHVKCWGSSYYGQLGQGDTDTRGDAPGEMGDYLPEINLGTDVIVLQLAVGNSHNCALLGDGSIKCWGYNAYGQLGLEDADHRGDAANEMGDFLATVNLGAGRTAVQVAVGEFHSCALLDNNDVKCWGYGSYGISGAGDAVVRGDGPNEMGDYLLPVDFGSGRTPISLWSGLYDACVLLDDGDVKCWGSNPYGELGLGDAETRGDGPNEMGDYLPPLDFGTDQQAISLGLGYSDSCAILASGDVKCWGFNYYGELGLGDAVQRGSAADQMGDNLPSVDLGIGRSAQQITLGQYATCALLDNADVKCWGYNSEGELGLGDNAHRGNAPGQMGDYLPAVSLW